MIKKKFVCKRCGHSFVVEVLEPSEAEYRKVRPVPVRCRKCGGTDLTRY